MSLTFFFPSERDPNGRSFTPGQPITYVPRLAHDPNSLQLLIKHIRTEAVWELPSEQISSEVQRLRPRPPSGSVPAVPDVEDLLEPATVTQPGFTVPQLPRGAYEVYYQSATGQDKPITITIVPSLGVSGPVAGEVGGEIEVEVKILGPLLPPRVLVRPDARASARLPRAIRRMLLWATGSRLAVLRVDVRLNDIENDQLVELAPGQTEARRTGATGVSRFRLAARQIGRTQVEFSTELLEGVTCRVVIHPRGVSPVFEPANSPLRMHTFGDSVAWGQGLLTDHKYDSLVGNWLQDQNQDRRVVLDGWAHSGAVTVIAPAHQSYDDDPTQVYHGEIPLPFPSVNAQLRQAQTEQRTDDAHVLILNSILNDVGLVNILDPFVSEADLVDRVRRHATPYRDTLWTIATNYLYRKAAILVPGYFYIITDDTPTFLIFGLLMALGLGPASAGLAAPLVKAKLIANCRIAIDTVHSILQDAVAAVNRDLGDDRILFVSPRFFANWAYGAPESRLWQLNPGPEDEVVDERATAGSVLLSASLPLDVKAQAMAAYPVASVGHPNVLGAQRYANRLIEALRPRPDLWDLTLPRRRLQVSVAPSTIPVNVITQQQVDNAGTTFNVETGATNHTFALEVRDAATGERIDSALVYQVEPGVRQPYRFIGLAGQSRLSALFQYSRDLRTGVVTPARLLISRRMHADVTVDLSWNVTTSP